MESVAHEARVDQEASEEDDSDYTVDLGPQFLVEDSDQREGECRNDAEPEHGVVTAVRDLAVELLVEGADVGLLDTEHENGCEEEEDAVVHLLTDNITDHGPLLESADIVTCAIVARSDEDGNKSDRDAEAGENCEVLKRDLNHALFGNEPSREERLVGASG